MQLAALVAEWAAPHITHVLSEDDLLAHAVAAARYYAAYGDIRSVSQMDPLPEAVGAAPVPAPVILEGDPEPDVHQPWPIKSLDLIEGETEITTGEWAVIKPLFMLYVERETAIRLEASRGLGLDPYGRLSSEIAQDIKDMEENVIPAKAFVHVVLTVG